MSDDKSIIVNVDNYVRAETSVQFERMMKMSKGMNKFAHSRRPIPLDRQNIVRMNRDTIYSSAIVDITKGATVTFPNAGERYMSVAVINEDNYTTAVLHDGGTFDLTMEEHGTSFVALVARTLVDPTDSMDLKIANELQDKIDVKAASTSLYTHPSYDKESHQITHSLLQKLGEGLTDASNCNGKKDEVSETRHMLTTAFGWGGLPAYEVVYESNTVLRPVGNYQLTVGRVPVNGFWSISIYNKAGYFQENPFSSYSLNNVTAEPNDDGSYTINFGEDGEGRENFLYIMDGWSYVVRFYQPLDEIQTGEWRFPEPKLVS